MRSPIRCYDELMVGGLALQTINVLHEQAADLLGSARRSCDELS